MRLAGCIGSENPQGYWIEMLIVLAQILCKRFNNKSPGLRFIYIYIQKGFCLFGGLSQAT